MTQAELLAEILAELRILREIALVQLRFPDLTQEERKFALKRIREMAA